MKKGGERRVVTDLSAIEEAYPGYEVKYNGDRIELTPIESEDSAVREQRRRARLGGQILQETVTI